MENDTLLPTFLASDDEDAIYDTSTLREMQAEADAKEGRLPDVAHPLSPEQIRAVIDEEITRFVALWAEKWRPRLEKRAWAIWHKQHRLQSKKLAAKKFGDELEEVRGRIERAKGEMERMEWKSEDELRPVVGNLKESVNRAQELEWNVNLLTGQRPPRPVKETVVEQGEGDVEEGDVEEGMLVDTEAVESAGGDADEEDEEDDLEGDDEEDEEDGEDELDGFIVDDEDVEMLLEEDIQIVEEDGDMDVDSPPRRHKKKFVRGVDIDTEKVQKHPNDDMEMQTDDGPVARFNDDDNYRFNNDGQNEQNLEISKEVVTDPPNFEDKQVPTSSSTTTPDSDIAIDKPIPQSAVETIADNPDPETSVTRPDTPSIVLDIPRANSRRLTRSQIREMSALPTPPREAEEMVLPLPPPPPAKLATVKTEFIHPHDDTVDTMTVDINYDSDIPWSFGDREIAEFLQCSEASASIATDYLTRAGGRVQKAVNLYFEDLELGRVSAPVEPNTAAPRPSKKEKPVSRKRKQIVDLSDDEQPQDSQYGLAPIFRPPFNDILPRGKQLRVVNGLLESIPPADLHATLKEIADIATHRKIDPSAPFLLGETAENCDAYWKVYLAYTYDLFGAPLYGKPTDVKLDRIHNSESFQKFYDRLVEYLGIRPPPTTPAKTKITQDDVELPSSQLSVVQESPDDPPSKRAKKDKKRKSKTKVVKPITKSKEQQLQEQELRKIADRERAQKKKGNFVTTTAEGDILVNPGKKVAEQPVLLHPQFANVMKPHQVEGLQFMWRQVTSPIYYPKLIVKIITITTGRGCLLAHTMGLGKTLQIIALLVTLSLVPMNAKLDLPEHLKMDESLHRDRRYLIICPPSIVVNWKNEFEQWTPPDCAKSLGDVNCIHPGKLEERIKITKRWFDNGGTLIGKVLHNYLLAYS